jgi:hypothetical protein
MADRLAVILASGGRRVLEMGLMYTRNAVKQGLLRGRARRRADFAGGPGGIRPDGLVG